MIALLLDDRCIACQACVAICPSDVFDPVAGSVPVIARVDDCQTCFLCELYCPADALYVDPDCETVRPQDADAIRRSGLLGQFRRESGWDEWSEGNPNLHWKMEEVFSRARPG